MSTTTCTALYNTIRCQLPASHTGMHYNPIGLHWSNTSRHRNAAA